MFTTPSISPQPLELPPHDIHQAQRFLTALDPLAREFCFQAIHDQRSRTLARTLHGSLNELAPTLTQLNQQGVGIFVTVCEVAPGMPRRTENVTRTRALFIDNDDPARTPEIEAAIANRGVTPSLVVESSPGRRHYYWLVTACPLERFTPAQRALAKLFGTDESVSDLPRVMRLPGFFHMKRDPFLVRLVTP